MALTYSTYDGDGSTTSFSYSSLANKLLSTDLQPVSSQLDVYVDNELQTLTTDYTVNTGSEEIEFVSAPASGTANVKIQRAMDRNSRVIDFTSVSILKASDIDDAIKQIFYLIQEIIDDFDDALRKNDAGLWDAQSIRLTGLSEGVDSTDAVTVAQLNAAVSGVVPMAVSGFGVYTATATSSQTDFLLTGGPSGKTTADYLVFVNGLQQKGTTNYTVTSGTPDTIVFTTGRTTGDVVEVRWTTGVTVGSIATDACTTASIVDGAVTEDKIDGTAGTANQVLMTDGTSAAFTTLTASHVSDFDTAVRTSRLDQMAAPTSAVSMNSKKITNLATPTSSGDAATKSYADATATLGFYYENVQFTGSVSSISVNPGFSCRCVMASSNSGVDDWDHNVVFLGDGSSYTYTHDSVDYTFSRVSSSEITVGRSPASGAFNIRCFFLKDP